MLVRPLAFTNVSWETFISVCKEKLGISPTRGLDKQGLSVELPASFMMSLMMDNDPRFLGLESRQYEHMSASFIIEAPTATLNEISRESQLAVFIKPLEEGALAIVSGTLDKWRPAIIHVNKTKKCRWVMNRCYLYFREAGFQELWKGYSSTMGSDDTFRLEKG